MTEAALINQTPLVSAATTRGGKRLAELGRMPQLDGLRTLAVAGVMCAHWWNPFPLGLPAGSGVQLFFVLSGFLITGILIDCWSQGEGPQARRQAIRNFYARRFLRIFPLFYATLAGAALLNVDAVRQTMLWNVTYLTNFYLFEHNGWQGRISHLWSLAVEEQFYLLWPTLVLFLPRRYLGKAIVGMVLLAPLFRIVVSLACPDRTLVSVLTPSCFDALGIGALLAWMIRQNDGLAGGKRLANWLLILGLPGFLLSWFGHRSGIWEAVTGEVFQTFLVMIFGWLVLNAAMGFSGAGRILAWKPVAYLGQISYALYVFHYFAPWMVYWLLAHLRFSEAQVNSFVNQRWLNLAAMTALTVGGAILSWHLFEKPINNLKVYFPYRQKQA